MTRILKLIDLGSNRSFDLSPGEPALLGRSSKADIPVFDLGCSRQQLELRFEDPNWIIEPTSTSVPCFYNERELDQPTPVVHGGELRINRSRFITRLEPQLAEVEPGVAKVEACPVAHTLVCPNENQIASPDMDLETGFPIQGDVTIGRVAGEGLCLDHIQVSRKHARIRQLPGKTILQDLGSANGTYLNGQPVVMGTVLKPGDEIGIGPFLLVYTGSALVPNSRNNNLQLEGKSLVRRVRNSDTNEPVTILDDVSLVIRPREFVCLLGPSGSGKTTLLSALSARVPANQGQVLINQSDLYENFESLKQDIAVVPQRDILHESLTVEEALMYTAKLRLPRDTSTQELRNRVTQLLQEVGLSERRKTRISQLSGGQRRRASLANELISNPSLLFLDEVTSGLDEQTDREMMQLFRGVAETGKTVVCVTHTLANIQENCHLVVILTKGGKLAFVGTPQEACDYFEIRQLGDVYQCLDDADQATAWQQKFLQSRYYHRYVVQRMSPHGGDQPRENRIHDRQYWQAAGFRLCHQIPILTSRYLRVWKSDTRALLGLVLQCLTVAVVLYLVFGSAIQDADAVFRETTLACQVLFVLSVSCFWFGCNNAAKEIVKERDITTKELQVNLDPTSYYLSKFLLQCVVAMAQSLALLGIVRMLIDLPGDWTAQAASLIVTAAAGVTIGLFLSAAATSEEMSLTMVPLVLIPQIILSDIFVELENVSKFMAQLGVSNYWSYGILRGTLPPEMEEQMNTPLVPPQDWTVGVAALGLQIILLIVFAILIIHIRDRVMSSSHKSLSQALREVPLIELLVRLLRPTGRRSTSVSAESAPLAPVTHRGG